MTLQQRFATCATDKSLDLRVQAFDVASREQLDDSLKYKSLVSDRSDALALTEPTK